MSDNESKEQAKRSGHGWWPWLRLVLLGLVLAIVTGLVMVLPILPTGQVVLEEGGVAPYHVRAPRQLTYESAILGEEEEERAAAEVDPVYTKPEAAVARQQLARAGQVLDYLGSVRADRVASPAQKRALILAVDELSDLPSRTVDTLLDLSDAAWDRVEMETLAVVDQAMRQEIREGYVDEVREEVPAMVSLDLSDEEATVTIALVERLLVANSFLDEEATAEARERAREEVGPVLRSFGRDQVIVREGERVNALHIEALEQFGLRQAKVQWPDLVGMVLLAMLGTAMLFLYLARVESDVLWNGSQLLLLVVLTSCFVLGAGLMVPSGDVLRYLFPAPALAMLITGTLGLHPGVAAATFLGGVVGVVADGGVEMVTYATLGGVIAALTVGRVERIGTLFRAGAFAALVHVTVLVIFRLPQDLDQPITLVITGAAGAAGGEIAASIALGGLFLIGPLFDITTTMRLMELSRPDHPLLQRLLREAPASYHHSLMVANLAEQAAERVGADTLLTRVGAYYHDVGKLARPYFFSENQVEGVNPHDRLDPGTSAEIIISHTEDGLKLARRHHLPRRIRAFIPEHHGTSWVSFLYDRAVQLAGDTSLVNENDFRYPGPKPQSRETALVMLADGCEAAVRSMGPTTAEEVAAIVDRTISERVADGQLSECDLTLRDLEIVRQVFTSALKGVFHPRIQYPKGKAVKEV